MLAYMQSAEYKEKTAPASYISASVRYDRNIFVADELMFYFSSKATEVTYKDIVVDIGFYTKTNTLLKDYQHTIYEFLRPGGNLDIEVPIGNLPASWDYKSGKISVKVKSAVPVQ